MFQLQKRLVSEETIRGNTVDIFLGEVCRKKQKNVFSFPQEVA